MHAAVALQPLQAAHLEPGCRAHVAHQQNACRAGSAARRVRAAHRAASRAAARTAVCGSSEQPVSAAAPASSQRRLIGPSGAARRRLAEDLRRIAPQRFAHLAQVLRGGLHVAQQRDEALLEIRRAAAGALRRRLHRGDQRRQLAPPRWPADRRPAPALVSSFCISSPCSVSRSAVDVLPEVGGQARQVGRPHRLVGRCAAARSPRPGSVCTIAARDSPRGDRVSSPVSCAGQRVDVHAVQLGQHLLRRVLHLSERARHRGDVCRPRGCHGTSARRVARRIDEIELEIAQPGDPLRRQRGSAGQATRPRGVRHLADLRGVDRIAHEHQAIGVALDLDRLACRRIRR